MVRSLRVLPLLLCLALTVTAQQAAGPNAKPQAAATKPPIGTYIKQGWKTLSRSMSECRSVVDTKVTQTPLLYLPDGMEVPAEVRAMQQKCKVRVEHLPRPVKKLGQLMPEMIKQHGLLYLPNRYVVPGGRFNEMYGWDSYFIILGLLRDGEQDLAKGMVENFFFEIENYGALLNANRTYFLTRSQPPLLTSMVLAVYDSQPDKQWLDRAYLLAERDYLLWNREPHIAGTTGLARYFDFGEGPVAETGDDPHYFAEVISALMTGDGSGREYVTTDRKQATGPDFAYQVCATKKTSKGVFSCAPRATALLTADYYKGDRSMRESGFDISFRFGPYSGSTHHFVPVCLNSLLYKAELDLGRMAGLLGKQSEAEGWRRRAEIRQSSIQKFLWNEKVGMFFDYDFTKEKQSEYRYASTFYPLWAGLATKEQAAAVVKNLDVFERPGGISTSARQTGMQWDEPYGWAPLQYFAVQGLRRYGFDNEAGRIAESFNSMIEENYRRDGTIREKYNVVTRSSETPVTAGYKENVIGFGWTNGVYLEFESPRSKAAAAGE